MEIQSRPELAFDEQQHLYTLGGLVLPSVTQIMSPMSSMLYAAVPQAALDAAADRGTRAHEQVSNYVRYGVLETDEDMTTTIDITPLIEVLLTLLGAIIARYAVPYFKAMLTNAQQEHVRELVHIAVYAAEKLYGSGYGQEKLNYAVEILKAHGIVLDKERLNAYIDAAIKEMEQSEVPKLEAVEIPQIEAAKTVE